MKTAVSNYPISSIVEEYVYLIKEDEDLLNGFLICSLPLKLNDELATKLIIRADDKYDFRTAQRICHEIKKLPCVIESWNKDWSIVDELRFELVERLYDQIGGSEANELRSLISIHYEKKLKNMDGMKELEYFLFRQAMFEAAYHKIFTTPDNYYSCAELIDTWRMSRSFDDQKTFVNAIEYLKPEIERFSNDIPEIEFFTGLRLLNEKKISLIKTDEEDDYREELELHFRNVWINGKLEQMQSLNSSYRFLYSMAAYYLASVTDNPHTSFAALENSLQWTDDPKHFGYIYYLLGIIQMRNGLICDSEETLKKGLNFIENPLTKARYYKALADLNSMKNHGLQEKKYRTKSIQLFQRARDFENEDWRYSLALPTLYVNISGSNENIEVKSWVKKIMGIFPH